MSESDREVRVGEDGGEDGDGPTRHGRGGDSEISAGDYDEDGEAVVVGAEGEGDDNMRAGDETMRRWKCERRHRGARDKNTDDEAGRARNADTDDEAANG